MRFLLRSSIATLAILGASVLFTALVGVLLLDVVERFLGPLGFEFALRWYLAFAVAALLGAAFLVVESSPMIRALILLAGIAVGYVLLADQGHELQKEFAWIRYPTAVALAGAGVGALLYSWRVRGWFWALFSFGFFFASADEILELHEYIGGKIERAFSLPHLTSDLITVVYAVAAAVVVGLALRYLLKSDQRTALRFLVSGVVLFATSTALDTVDIVFDRGARILASVLGARGYVFSDRWYLFYEPKRFANSLEEVLEYTAAVLFLLAMTCLLFPRFYVRFRKAPARFLKSGRSGVTSVLVLAVALAVLFVPASGPFLDRVAHKRLGGPAEGLKHSDDLFFDPEFGVLLANEGGGNVFQWNNGVLKKVSDPARRLRDVDSITAAGGTMYVADGAQGKIFSSSGNGTWETVSGRTNGLKRPEGIVFAEGFLVGVDESQRALFRLPLPVLLPDASLATPAPVVEWYRPGIKAFRSPEGIAYHAGLKRFLVTDDATGFLWSVEFGKSVEPFSVTGIPLVNPEDIAVLPDGDIMLTDNGRGEMIRLGSDGLLKKRIRTRRMYRDLQGITADNQGNLFVVTADAHASSSFMPSFLFRVQSNF